MHNPVHYTAASRFSGKRYDTASTRTRRALTGTGEDPVFTKEYTSYAFPKTMGIAKQYRVTYQEKWSRDVTRGRLTPSLDVEITNYLIFRLALIAICRCELHPLLIPAVRAMDEKLQASMVLCC